jgi:hypothetical protein
MAACVPYAFLYDGSVTCMCQMSHCRRVINGSLSSTRGTGTTRVRRSFIEMLQELVPAIGVRSDMTPGPFFGIGLLSASISEPGRCTLFISQPVFEWVGSQAEPRDVVITIVITGLDGRLLTSSSSVSLKRRSVGACSAPSLDGDFCGNVRALAGIDASRLAGFFQKLELILPSHIAQQFGAPGHPSDLPLVLAVRWAPRQLKCQTS